MGKKVKTIIISAVVLAIIIIAFVFWVIINASIVNSGTFLRVDSGISDESWWLQGEYANGKTTFRIDLMEEDLSNTLVINSSLSEGEMYLTVTQGELEQRVNLNGTEDIMRSVDLSIFTVGRVEMQLSFNRARNIDVMAYWRKIE